VSRLLDVVAAPWFSFGTLPRLVAVTRRDCARRFALASAAALAFAAGACGGGSKGQSSGTAGSGGAGTGTAGAGGGGGSGNDAASGSGGSGDDGAAASDAGPEAPPFVPPAPVTATIGADGGVISLPGFADVTFPAGAFAADQVVTVEAITPEPTTAALFADTTAIFNLGARSAYDLDIATGSATPSGDVTIQLTVPDALGPADVVNALGDFLTASDLDHYEVFEMAAATSRDATTLTVTIPGERFVALHRPDGQNAAVFVLGRAADAAPLAAAPLPPSSAAGDGTSRIAAPSACPTGMIGPPLASVVVTSQFDPGRKIVVGGQTYIGHFGTDLAAAVGDPVYAVGNGTVVASFISPSFGECIILGIPGVGSVLYGHLQTGSRLVNKGDHVCIGQQIGSADTTGLVTGPHLHFELDPTGVAFNANATKIDPLPCIDTSLPVPQTCAKWSGSIHAVETHNESSMTSDGLSTTISSWMESTEHTWTLGTVHEMGVPGQEYDVVDAAWMGQYIDSDGSTTTFTTGTCPGSSEDTVGSGIGGGMSQLAFIGETPGLYTLSFTSGPNSFTVPLTATMDECEGSTMSMELHGVIELITAIDVPGLMELTPSPADPNTFVGSGTLMHTEMSTGTGMLLLDQSVDWNIHKLP